MKFCVIGLGRFGYQLATSLAQHGMEILVIDSNEATIESIQDKVTQAICMRVTDEHSLRAIGVEDMDVVIVATAENFAESVLVTALLKKELHIPRVIARAINSMHEEILKLVGADTVILPERDMGMRFADKLSIPFIELVHVTDTFAMTQIKAPTSYVGKCISELKPIKTRKLSCVAVQKGDEFVLIGNEYRILEHDVLIFAGSRKNLATLIHE